jgi:hypothetical protein
MLSRSSISAVFGCEPSPQKAKQPLQGSSEHTDLEEKRR